MDPKIYNQNNHPPQAWETTTTTTTTGVVECNKGQYYARKVENLEDLKKLLAWDNDEIPTEYKDMSHLCTPQEVEYMKQWDQAQQQESIKILVGKQVTSNKKKVTTTLSGKKTTNTRIII